MGSHSQAAFRFPALQIKTNRDAVAECRGESWRVGGGQRGRKSSSDQINATVSTSDKSCLGSALFRAGKASTASSPVSASNMGEGEESDCCHSRE